MAEATPTQATPQAPTDSVAQALWQLYNLNGAYDAKKSGGAALADANGNLLDRTNATNAAADQFKQLIAALMGQMNQDPSSVAGDIEARAGNIFSGLAGTVDRANAISASQAGAGLLKRGMGDSTQATDVINENTRKYQDVYQKLKEAAYAQAMKEQQQRANINANTFGNAVQGMSTMSNNAQRAAELMASNAAKTAGTNSDNFGAQLSRMLATEASQTVRGYAKDLIGATGIGNRVDNQVKDWASSIRDMFSSDTPLAGFSDNTPADSPWSGSTTQQQMDWQMPAADTPSFFQSAVVQEPTPFAWAQPDAPTSSTNWFINPEPEWSFE